MGGGAAVGPAGELVRRRPRVCGEDADREFKEPLITSRVKGAVDVVAFTASWSPVGAVANERMTVSGCSSRVVDALAPWASVAVSVSSRWAGYSWSGPKKDSLATPGKESPGWLWQLDGQWRIVTCHDSRLGGTLPSWASEADPLKKISSPTSQVVPAAGVSITGTGGVLDAEMTTESVPVSPPGSVTRNPAVTVAGDE